MTKKVSRKHSAKKDSTRNSTQRNALTTSGVEYDKKGNIINDTNRYLLIDTSSDVESRTGFRNPVQNEPRSREKRVVVYTPDLAQDTRNQECDRNGKIINKSGRYVYNGVNGRVVAYTPELMTDARNFECDKNGKILESEVNRGRGVAGIRSTTAGSIGK